ncbi:WG repeat-containing protein [Flavobacterium sp. M31R6]|uniref:WG repeat-containing protein n=1 Tax=Flavobacterium sp. M31R6 TaxID=2739062 RepID=UPI0015695905|nr:WG repeat-containing protein [Flavobacterium sp. M31R6]QKJ61656.1 WG repeat-containing protein [Flavobacterium sp. M31R6]
MGYIDNKGNTIIPSGKYTFLNPIDEEGMIFAQRGNKYGYIDINQKIIVPFEYDELTVFSNELACAKKNGKFGFINRKGVVVIPFQFEEESYFQDSGFALVQKNNKFGFIDKSGNEIVPIIYQNAQETTLDSLVILSKNGKWAFFSNQGHPMTDFVYDEIAITKRVVNNHDESTLSKNGLILVRKNGQIGYLDKNLKTVISFGKYSFGERFNQNRLAIVSKNKRFGIINEFDKEIVKTEYDTVEHPERDYHESNTFVARKKNYFVLFNENGKKVADKVKEYFFDRYTVQNKNMSIYQIQNLNGLVGVIDDNGKVVIPTIYEEIGSFRGESKTVVKRNGKYGLIDSENKIVYPIDNEGIETWKDIDYYIIKKGDKTWIIDKNLKKLLNFEYQDLSPCSYEPKNRFIAKKNNTYGVIDRMGKIIIPFEYSEMSNWVEYGPGSDYHFVTKNNKKGLITKEGKIIIPPIYDSLFYNNDETIILSKIDKYGVVTIRNKSVIPFIYDMIYVENSYSKKKADEFYVRKEGKYFVVNNKNKVVRANVSDKEINDKFHFEINGYK